MSAVIVPQMQIFLSWFSVTLLTNQKNPKILPTISYLHYNFPLNLYDVAKINTTLIDNVKTLNQGSHRTNLLFFYRLNPYNYFETLNNLHLNKPVRTYFSLVR